MISWCQYRLDVYLLSASYQMFLSWRPEVNLN